MATSVTAGPRILDSRWPLPAEFRKGGSARIYRSSDLEHEHPGEVAVKVLDSSLLASDRLLALQFSREQRNLGKLRHPHIIPLLDGGHDRETDERYLIFPWLDHDLEAVLKNRGPLNWPTWWTRYGHPVLQALAFAHDNEVAHRDVKPGNVLIGPEGEPLLSDFGISVMTSNPSLGETLRWHGTPPYSPRDYEDERFNMQRDVHAFGVMCVIALRCPPTKDLAEKPYETLDAAAASLKLEDDIQAVLGTTLLKADHRPANAGLLLARFDRCGPAQPKRLPTLPLSLGRTAEKALLEEYELSKASELPTVLNAELGDEIGVMPLGRDFKDGSSSEGHYYLYGGELRLHCKVGEPKPDHLVVLNAWRQPAWLVERERSRSHLVQVRLRFGQPTNPAEAAKLIASIEEQAHEQAVEADRAQREDAKAAPLRVWKGLLAAGRAVQRERERPFAYTSFSPFKGDIRFDLASDPGALLVDEERVAVITDDEVPVAGDIVSVNARQLTLRLTIGRASDIPANGQLKVDTFAARVALRRQEAALEALEQGLVRRRDLLDLLMEPAQVRAPEPWEPPSFSRSDLDEPKRQAVAAALGTRDLLLVEGPPGTGKTTFISELVIAELGRNPNARILLAAQTHAALDNVLERVAEHAEDVRMLRIARRDETRVAESVRDLLIDSQVERWRRAGIRSGRRWLAKWATAQGLDVTTIELAIRLSDLAGALDDQQRLRARRTELEARLQDIRRERRRDPDSTAAESVRVVGEQVQETIEALGAAGDDARGHAERLVELGANRKVQELMQSSSETLRDQAQQLLPTDRDAARKARSLLGLLADWHARLGRSPEFRAAALIRAQIVAATCVGYAAIRGSENVEFDLCIIDEASKATSTELLVPMTRADRWVLVGDHRQLPPFVDDALAKPEVLADYGLNERNVQRTLFDDLREQLPDQCVKTLTEQHRMVPAIGDLISQVFYDGRLRSAPRKLPKYARALSGAAVAWHSTARAKDKREVRANRSWLNPYEGRCVRALLLRLDFYAKADGKQVEVAVLSGYKGQVGHLQRLLADDESTWKNLHVSVSTVDAFQGREADVAIYSVTRSNPEGRIGFLAERRRLNVALSRAKDLLLVVGDHATAAAGPKENPLREVIDYITEHPDDCAMEQAQP